MGPLEQLGIYGYFELVITHRFHDCVFCLKNSTPFLVYVKSRKTFMTADNDSKHISLLKDFGLYPYGFLGCVDDGIPSETIDAKITVLKNKFNTVNIVAQMSEVKQRYFDFLHMTVSNN